MPVYYKQWNNYLIFMELQNGVWRVRGYAAREEFGLYKADGGNAGGLTPGSISRMAKAVCLSVRL